MTIEVDNPDTGEKEKLQVQLTYVLCRTCISDTCAHMLFSFNATVLGSKGKVGDDEEAKEEEEKKEGKSEENNEEKEDKADFQEE